MKTKRNGSTTRRQPDRTVRLQVVMEVDEDGKYIAWCPALEACYTQGDTYEEAIDNIKDVIAMCLEELDRQRRDELRQEIIEGCREMADVYLELEREYHPLEEEVQRGLDALPPSRRRRARPVRSG